MTGASLAVPAAWAVRPPPPRAASPMVAVDPLLVQTGLTTRWAAGLRQDLGWTANWSPMASAQVLQALEQGLVNAGLFLSHPRADELDKQGLIHDRHAVARTDVLLIGPTQDLAGIRGETDASRALMQILAAARAGKAAWQPAPEGSPLAALADQLTHGMASGTAAPTPATPNPPQGRHEAVAYQLVTRAQWLKAPTASAAAKIWPMNDPQMSLKAEIACSFRARHEGARLLVSWLQWPLAQSAVKAAQPAWQRV